MASDRKVDPEILDNISPHDPGAIHSRQDLRRLNALMLNARVMAGLLTWCWQQDGPPKTIVDIGGGDATFAVEVAKRMSSRWPSTTVVVVDQSAIVRDETRRRFADCGWRIETVMADVFDFMRTPTTGRADIVMANLFLHHLTDQQLSQLFASSAAFTQAFAVCEPRRNRFALLSSKLVFAVGANRVTRHDAPASVRAGFRDRELSRFFTGFEDWETQEFFAAPFTHGFAARRSGISRHV